MSFVPPFLRGTYSFSLRSKDNRDSAPNLTGMLPPAKAQERPKIVEAVPGPLGPAQPDAKTVLEMLNHAAEALDYLQTRCRELEASADEAAARARKSLADAQRTAAVWEQRARASEAQVEELETRLADADQTAMELRARLICLYGKLAASVDTVRFQTLARALADQEQASAQDEPHQHVAAA
jgi:hypothetical protein